MGGGEIGPPNCVHSTKHVEAGDQSLIRRGGTRVQLGYSVCNYFQSIILASWVSFMLSTDRDIVVSCCRDYVYLA